MQFLNSSSFVYSHLPPCSNLEISFIIGGATFVVLILVLSTFGNSLVCLAVYRQPYLRTTSNAFIVNLAVNDIIASSILLPLEALYLICFPRVPLSGQAINVWNSLFLCFLASSVLNFTAVTADRYIRIVFPLRYDTVMTSSRCFSMLCGMWIYSSLLAVLMYFAFDTPVDGVYSFTIPSHFFISFLVINVAIPFCGIVLLYCKIFRIAKYHNRRVFTVQPVELIDGHPKVLRQSTSMVKELRTTKTIGIVICCFVVTWFPFLIYQLVFIYMDQSDCTLDKIDTVMCWFTYLSGVLNPITYAARDSSFRQAFRYKITVCK